MAMEWLRQDTLLSLEDLGIFRFKPGRSTVFELSRPKNVRPAVYSIA